MLKKLLGAAALTAILATSACTQNWEYVGPSSTALDGDKGILAYHEACSATFEGASWCTTKKIVTGGRSPGAPNPAYASGEWVIPVIIEEEGSGLRDFSGVGVTPQADINCRGWTGGADVADRKGMVFRTTVSAGPDGVAGFGFLPCNVARPAACCVQR